jgi:putative glutamine amidotransferase
MIQNKMSTMIKIGITDCSKYQNYHNWIAAEPDVEIIKLSYRDNNAADAAKCDGVILSGGEDVHPSRYGREDYIPYCEFDEKRDEFEWRVLEFVDKHQLPLLGICRGLQVANVYYGGTLIPHIPAFGRFDHANHGGVDRYHSVLVDINSQLKGIVGAESGEINSAHHQAADRIAPGFVANALSPDGVVEGLEREVGKEGPFLQLVQWHPERMKNLESVFSKNIKRSFIEACRKKNS